MISFPTKLIEQIPGLISLQEAQELFERAQMIPENGYILELGSFLGRSAAALATGAPTAKVYSVDVYAEQPAMVMDWFKDINKNANMSVMHTFSAEGNTKRLVDLGIHNVTFIHSKSDIAPVPDGPIDLLWIDCNHTYEYAKHDIEQYGPRATTICLHDYESGGKGIDTFPGVTRAVTEFIIDRPEWYIAHQVFSTITLCRK